MVIYCRQIKRIGTGETRVVQVDFTDMLASTITLTGTPTVVEVTTTALTLSNKAVNTGTYVDDGRTVGIGKAVQFTCTGGVANTLYKIRISCATTGSPAETLERGINVIFI